MKAFLICSFTFVATIVCGVCVSRSLDGESADVELVKDYAVNVISPLLENFCMKQGRFPRSLNELPGFQLSDKAKKMGFVYGASWPYGHYEFSFSPDDLAGITGRWDYHSNLRLWKLDR